MSKIYSVRFFILVSKLISAHRLFVLIIAKNKIYVDREIETDIDEIYTCLFNENISRYSIKER